MNKIINVIFFLSLTIIVNAQTDLEKALFDLPNVIFEKIDTLNGYSECFVMKVKQPIDHLNPSKGHFYQKVYLSHKSFDAPTVLVTEGYFASRHRIAEISKVIGANQIRVEHRFFGPSSPDSLEYEYLTLEQVTADLHKINTLFKNIYKGKWISSGVSKGGQTTIFYRYFYPEDVDASVPYVAPLNLAFEEERIYQFLDTIGSDECRKNIYDYQIRILDQREEALQRLNWYAKGSKLGFDYLTLEESFEFTVLEFPFSFWQWGYSCDSIPGPDATLDEDLEYLMKVCDMNFFADEMIDYFASHYYQAATQMGYYAYDTDDFKGKLKALPYEPNPHAAFLPDKMDFQFDDTLIKKVDEWLKKNGNEFIYIYGANDTWSATAVQPVEGLDAVWFFMKDKSHGDARIKNMTEEERNLLVETLERWLEIEIEE